MYSQKREQLVKEITNAVNRVSFERYLNMPDYVIAEMMVSMVESVIEANSTVAKRRLNDHLNAIMNGDEDYGSDEPYSPRVLGENYED